MSINIVIEADLFKKELIRKGHGIFKDAVIYTDLDGNILSKFEDDIWDMSYCKRNRSQNNKLDFTNKYIKKYSYEAKKFMILYILFRQRKNTTNKPSSISTLTNIRNGFIIPICKFALQKKIESTSPIFSNEVLIKEFLFINKEKRHIVQNTNIMIKLLSEINQNVSGINFQLDLKNIYKIISDFKTKLGITHQTEVIPMEIYTKSISQRIEQVNYLKKFEEKIASLIDEILKIDKQTYGIKKKTRENKKAIKQANFLIEIEEYFNISINCKSQFFIFINRIFGTCQHLIFAFSGIRSAEILSMMNNCLEIIKDENGKEIVILKGKSTKTSNENETYWITSKIIIEVINLLNTLNVPIVKYVEIDIKQFPLFWPPSLIKPKIMKNLEKILTETIMNKKNETLSLDQCNILIKENHIQELEKIEFDRDWRNDEEFKIGRPWKFKTHQYRRSLTVYSIQSGLVSIGTLQGQLKHFFRDMTWFYGNGASRAKNIIGNISDLADDYKIMKPKLDAIAYVFNAVMGKEEDTGNISLGASHGKFIEENIKQKLNNEEITIFELIKQTEEKCKKGLMLYKDTPVGGCISVELCTNRMTRSIVSCLTCDSSIIMYNKLKRVIRLQEQFICTLNPNNVEYREEIKTLEEIEIHLISILKKEKKRIEELFKILSKKNKEYKKIKEEIYKIEEEIKYLNSKKEVYTI